MTRSQAMEQFVAAMPKVELHVHLEGSIQPATLLALARRHGIDLPADDEEGLRQWFQFRDFEHFVDIYLTCCRCLRDPEDFQWILDQFMAEQERQNVLYSEVHFTIGTHLANGVNGEEVADALWETLEEGRRQRRIRVQLIPDIVRDVGPAMADQTLEWALAGRERGVVGLGLSGFESSADEPYREHFQVAADSGLHCVAHAGEHAGPESIRSVLEVCRAERIGHGITSIDDKELVEELATRAIPLEICPTSNVRLGAAPGIAEHPFARLSDAGVVVTINSDDPPLFETDLNREYLALSQEFGYGPAELAAFSRNALRAAFLDRADREALEEHTVDQFQSLGVAVEDDQFVVDDELTR